MNRIILYLKYFKNKKFEEYSDFNKMFLHAKKYPMMFCYHRASYLYWKLKELNLNPKILKYHLKNNQEQAPFSKQFKHISRNKYGFHFVIE